MNIEQIETMAKVIVVKRGVIREAGKKIDRLINNALTIIQMEKTDVVDLTQEQIDALISDYQAFKTELKTAVDGLP